MSLITRRQAIHTAAAAGLAMGVHSSLAPLAQAQAPANALSVGIMGVNGRGFDLAKTFVAQPGLTIAYLCDVDERAIAKATAGLTSLQQAKPQGVADFRRILEDKSVDALVIAAPDHWHAPATIAACAAGKHVYVEKPLSHNPREGELAVEAATKHGRVVTMGNQRRSWPAIQEAMKRLREGVIGEVHFSRGWYNNRRGSIGRGTEGPAPTWLDYALWQGPAPRRPYRDNMLHYNWHWFWHWGTGELGNNGVHCLDLCRWGLGVDYPLRVTSSGGRYYHDDDQETPDTHLATFEFPGGRTIAWDGQSCTPRGFEGSMFGASFHGTRGSLVLLDNGYKIYEEKSGTAGDHGHIGNFLATIRAGGDARPASPVDEAHKTTLLCHLGNIAWRTRRVLECDPKSGRIQNDPQAQQLWSREYEAGWEPKV
jgi:predicted dehydrogenase